MIVSEINDLSIDFSTIDKLGFQSVGSVGLGKEDNRVTISITTGEGLHKQSVSLSFSRQQLVQLSQEMSAITIGLEAAKSDA